MTNSTAIAPRTTLVQRATLLLVVLLLGATFHFLHHLQDPGCGTGPERTSHACAACSGLHGSTLVAAEIAAPAPLALAWSPRAFVAASAPIHRPHFAAAPRAPPES